MTLLQVCVCYLIRHRADGTAEVLLGRKKRGLGAGKIVGLGGKLEPGESALEAVIREVAEESGVGVEADALHARGVIRYSFPFRESWSQVSQPFVTESFLGDPVESDEIEPAWFALDRVPFDRMWDDARHWLPGVLSGDRVDAWFEFGEDCETVSASRVEFSPG